MISLKSTAAIALAALLLSTSLANAGARSSIKIDDNRTVAAVSAGDEVPAADTPKMERTKTNIDLSPKVEDNPLVTNPGGGLIDPKLDIDDPKVEPKASPAEIITAGGLKLSPYALKCWITDNGWVWFKNVGTETIPAGSVMIVKWPDGTESSFKVDSDIKVGAGVDISVPPSVKDATDKTHCSASIKQS